MGTGIDGDYAGDLGHPSDTRRGRVPTLETPMSPGGSQASAGEGLSPCNIGIGIGSAHSGTAMPPRKVCAAPWPPQAYRSAVAWVKR